MTKQLLSTAVERSVVCQAFSSSREYK